MANSPEGQSQKKTLDRYMEGELVLYCIDAGVSQKQREAELTASSEMLVVVESMV